MMTWHHRAGHPPGERRRRARGTVRDVQLHRESPSAEEGRTEVARPQE